MTIKSLSTILLSLSLPIIILGSDSFFNWQQKKVQANPQIISKAAETRFVIMETGVFKNLNPLLQSIKLENGLGYEENEIQHLIDVWVWISVIKIIISLSIIIFVFSHILTSKIPRITKKKPTLLPILLIVAIILMLKFFWQDFFLGFHNLFFPQGNFAFPRDSLLIILFPEIFWYRLFWSYAAILLLEITIWTTALKTRTVTTKTTSSQVE
jgi:uncharacterized membrane protein